MNDNVVYLLKIKEIIIMKWVIEIEIMNVVATPFCHAFATVDSTVYRKQTFVTVFMIYR